MTRKPEGPKSGTLGIVAWTSARHINRKQISEEKGLTTGNLIKLQTCPLRIVHLGNVGKTSTTGQRSGHRVLPDEDFRKKSLRCCLWSWKLRDARGVSCLTVVNTRGVAEVVWGKTAKPPCKTWEANYHSTRKLFTLVFSGLFPSFSHRKTGDTGLGALAAQLCHVLPLGLDYLLDLGFGQLAAAKVQWDTHFFELFET